jgi:hypothetical protein
MKRVLSLFTLFVSLFAWEVLPVDRTCDRLAGDYRWVQDGQSLALERNGTLIWKAVYDKKEGRPYFHPLSLAEGTPLTWFAPSDHRWHRGFWFSWKLIDGINYWDDEKTGQMEGESEITAVKAQTQTDFSAELQMTISYHPAGKPEVLSELRRIKITAPDRAGGYQIDWESSFQTANETVLLERTPIPGQPEGVSWGGYAGLSLRTSPDISSWSVINSEGQRQLAGHGKNARWLDFLGTLKGGRLAGATFFDHPANPRHPSPWVVIADPARPFGYFSPAFLFNSGYALKRGEKLTLRYGILIHEGLQVPSEIEAAWKRWVAESTKVSR